MPTLIRIPNPYNLPIVPIKVNSKLYRLLVDTGASVTVFSPELAALAGNVLTFASTFNGVDVKKHPCEVANINFKFVGVCIGQVHVTPATFVNGLDIDGIIGQDILYQFTSVTILRDRVCFTL